MILPQPIRPGARIRVVAPSGPFSAERLETGLARLKGHMPLVDPALGQRRTGYLASPDNLRKQELQNAFEEENDAIWIARGGYGLARIIDGLDFSALLARPRPVIGFSDTTVLHAALWARGLGSIHAANGTTLVDTSEEDFVALLQLLECGERREFSDLLVYAPGEAEGTLVGGNLTVLFAEAAAGRLELPERSIVVLEDITETSYRVDRMLSALLAHPMFARCVGVVFGEFTDCSPGKFEVPVEQVLTDFAQRAGVPVLARLPVGHGAQNAPLLLGSDARLSSKTASLLPL